MLGRPIKYLWTIMLAVVLLNAAGWGFADGPPYPPSPVIAGITWHWETHRSAGTGSDLWPVTWGPDGHVYTAWGDGGGFVAADAGRFAKWSRIELVFEGPASRGTGEPNPFEVLFDVNFTGPRGRQYRVPGFYDGDGKGGLDGNVWKVRFSADELGRWTYSSVSKQKELHGQTGHFTVIDIPKDAAGFWKWGRLEYTGTAKNRIRYLKFRDGPYWLKAGCDDPENFLGKYKNYNTLAKRKAAIDYLAQRGVNSLYIMTHNLGGD
jgi:hypothetical protein